MAESGPDPGSGDARDAPVPRLAGLVAELRRRRVFRALVGWGVVSFAVLQVSEPILHALGLPDWTLKGVVAILAAGFPATALLAWVFDLTAGGVERTAPPEGAEGAGGVAPAGVRGARLALLLAGIGVVAGTPVLAYHFLWGAGSRDLRESSPPPSVAVLPFADMSPGKDQEYFADGVAEEILNALTQVQGLKVIGRTSSFSFKGKAADLREIGRQLDVGALLEGSVSRDGGRVRVTARLVRTADGSRLWSERYDRELTGLFALQDEVARAVVARVAPVLAGVTAAAPGPVPQTSPEAYTQVLLGRKLYERFDEASARRSLRAFERALELDPRYAPAWAGLSATQYVVSQLSDRTAPALEKALASAERAIALDPGLSAGYAARAHARLGLWDWVGARADAERSVTLDPGSAVAYSRRSLVLRLATSDPTRGLPDLERAIALDPLSAYAWHQLALVQHLRGRSQEARAAIRRLLEIDPGFLPAATALAQLELRAGRPAEARALLAARPGGITPFWTGVIEHALGHPGPARQALEEVTRERGDDEPEVVAELHAWRGEPDLAFAWLDKALARRSPGLRYVRVASWLEPLHADPRWAALLRKMNLPVD